MEIDIIEQSIQDISPDLMKILLSDKTTKGFIRWGSDNYITKTSKFTLIETSLN